MKTRIQKIFGFVLIIIMILSPVLAFINPDSGISEQDYLELNQAKMANSILILTLASALVIIIIYYLTKYLRRDFKKRKIKS